MFDYPKQAEFNRVLPKSKIYDFARPNRAMRDRFVSQIDQIIWRYKLSPETINLPPRNGVQEIQVFRIALKTKDPAEGLLHTIDNAIPFHIFYQLTFDGRVKSIAAYKRPNDTDPSKSVVTGYFETPWRSDSSQREPLPVSIDLAGLYEQMLRRHISIPSRLGESLREQVERVLQIRDMENECSQLEDRLSKEIQFNRKVEVNALFRCRKAELDQLRAS